MAQYKNATVAVSWLMGETMTGIAMQGTAASKKNICLAKGLKNGVKALAVMPSAAR